MLFAEFYYCCTFDIGLLVLCGCDVVFAYLWFLCVGSCLIVLRVRVGCCLAHDCGCELLLSVWLFVGFGLLCYLFPACWRLLFGLLRFGGSLCIVGGL